MSTKQSVKNIINAAYDVIPHLLINSPKHQNVVSVSVRTKESMLIPIYERQQMDADVEVDEEAEEAKEAGQEPKKKIE